jgi:hypothetical protein
MINGDAFVQLKPGGEQVDAALDPEFLEIAEKNAATSRAPISASSRGDDWDAPFDLRIARPRAVDLRALWGKQNRPEPADLTAALGPKRPILLTHVMTPFPRDGNAPARVWSLGYEIVILDVDADTVGVAPSNEVFKIADLGQSVDLAIDFGGRFGIVEEPLRSGMALRAVTSQRFLFKVSMQITLRKVVGAPVGNGGAVWKMFRQNEQLDQPHTLLQTVLFAENATSLRCTVKTWAKQAGWLGTRWGARLWSYEDQPFEISLV